MSRSQPTFVVALVLVLAVLGATLAGAVLTVGRGPVGCPHLPTPHVAGARILAVTAVGRADAPTRCDITVVLTHPPLGDRVRIELRLPRTAWNGRFQAVGGGGFTAGSFGHTLADAVRRGYAAASTDAGLATPRTGHPAWALRRNRTVDAGRLTNFAYRSVHDMSRVGEQVVTAFYGRPPAYSYFTGCSTGGRQGLAEAQRYPGDFDGIIAAAPAIYWNRLTIAQLWPQVVMNEAGVYPTACELEAFNRAAVAACDRDDGRVDGVIDRPETCRFDPGRLVGTAVHCQGTTNHISRSVADVVRRIWQGPTTRTGRQLWYGLLPGASFGWLAGTAKPLFGPRHGAPFPVAADWVRYFLRRQPGFDPATIRYPEFERLFTESLAGYSAVIGSDDPDLSAFRAAGGKMITWHGLADQAVFPQGTIEYRQQVEAVMGGARATDDFYRVFLAPGVAHCAGGAGPVPTDPLAALVDWVEHGRAPDTLPAATTDARRPPVAHNLCRYPRTAQAC